MSGQVLLQNQHCSCALVREKVETHWNYANSYVAIKTKIVIPSRSASPEGGSGKEIRCRKCFISVYKNRVYCKVMIYKKLKRKDFLVYAEIGRALENGNRK